VATARFSTGILGDVAVVPGVANQSVRVFGYYINAAASLTVKFTDGAGGAVLDGPHTIGANLNGPWSPMPLGEAIFQTSPGNALVLNAAGLAALCSGMVAYTQGI
jgi:hypothetical protein